MSNTNYITVTDTAKLIRKALKEAFPGIKFSVRSEGGRGASIDVRWTDGPAEQQVADVCDRFRGGYFDGSIDYRGTVYALMGGQRVRFGADFVFYRRDYSPAVLARIVDRVAREWGIAATVEQYEAGSLYATYPSGNASGHSMQSLINIARARHTCMLSRPSATADGVEVIGSDGYSLSNGSGKAFGDDEVIAKLARAK